MAKSLDYSYEIHIGAPASKVWQGIVDASLTRQYVFGTRLESKLKKGSPYAYLGDGDFKAVDGEILEVEPGRRLVMTWSAHWSESVNEDPPSRVTYELSPTGEAQTRLRVIHDGFERPNATYTESTAAWPLLLSSLKSLLETGKPLAA